MVKIKSLKLVPVNRRSIIAGCTVVVLASTVAGMYFFVSRPSQSTDAPAFDVVIPGDRTVEELGGWQKVSPAENDPAFSYTDEIKNVEINVSQQPIPESFVGNVTGNVRQLAESFNATTTLEVSGTPVYIGRSARGPQSVVFAKNNTLVLIMSERPVSNIDWISYINRLVSPDTEGPTF